MILILLFGLFALMNADTSVIKPNVREVSFHLVPNVAERCYKDLKVEPFNVTLKAMEEADTNRRCFMLCYIRGRELLDKNGNFNKKDLRYILQHRGNEPSEVESIMSACGTMTVLTCDDAANFAICFMKEKLELQKFHKLGSHIKSQ